MLLALGCVAITASAHAQEPQPYADQAYDPAAMAAARATLRQEHGGEVYSKVMLNLGEIQLLDHGPNSRWDGEAWIGGDMDRLVLKSEGDADAHRGDGEVQLLFSRAVSPYFWLQGGLRQDFGSFIRTYATIGLEGLAPDWFEVEGALFVSDRGDVSARAEGLHDVLLTQRLVLQPRVELNLVANGAPDRNHGPPPSDAEFGLRLRYEIRRTFAPYIGVTYQTDFGPGDPASRARSPHGAGGVAGLRAFF